MAITKKPYLGLQGQPLSWAITLCAGSAFLLFGYDQGVLGSIISGSDFLGALNIARDDPDTLSTVVSIYDIGVSLLDYKSSLGHYDLDTDKVRT
jgi:hypothetical protein